MVLFLTFLVSAIITMSLIPVLMRYADVLQLLDMPNDRKVHDVAIPHCGGLGLATGAVISIFLFTSLSTAIFWLVIGSFVIIIFGVLDDRFGLNYKWKFFGQFIAVVCTMWGGIYFSLLPFTGLESSSPVITLPLTLVFAIGVINAVNLSDGLDGLAAGVMLMTFAVIAFLAIISGGTNIAVIALAVIGGIVGFLWFNIHPAVVFMGDTGSQFIGYIAVFLSIYLTQVINPVLNPALPLLLLGLPILDTLSVMVRRIRVGRSPFSPDQTHIHHRLMEYGFSHAEAVGSIYVMQGLFLASALVFKYASDFVVIGTYLLLSGSILWFFYWAKTTQWRLHAKTNEGEKRGARIWRNETLFNFCRHYINYAVAIFLATQLYCLQDRILELSVQTQLVMFSGFLGFLLLPKIIQDFWIRLGVYLSAIFSSVMRVEFPEMELHDHWLMNIFLFVLIVVVSIAIRMTRKSKFRMTTQDVLVALFLIASVLLVDNTLFEHGAFRLVCLVYALEYLLHRDFYHFRLLRYIAALSGIIIVALSLPTVYS